MVIRYYFAVQGGYLKKECDRGCKVACLIPYRAVSSVFIISHISSVDRICRLSPGIGDIYRWWPAMPNDLDLGRNSLEGGYQTDGVQ